MTLRRERLWLAGLLALALAARVAFIALLDPRPSFRGGDGPFYLTVAQNLANGYGFVFGQLATYKTEPVLTAGPLYPAYLAAFYVALGGHTTHPISDPPIRFTGSAPWILGARLGQAVLSTLTAAFAYALARRMWGSGAGLVAAGIMAFDLRFIVGAGNIYTETLSTFLLAGALVAYLSAHQTSSTRRYGLAWIVLGLAVLARPTVVVVFPALALHLWFSRPRREAARQTAGLVAMAGLIMAPWLVRHYLLFGNFSLMGSSAASHFWLGAIREGQWEGLADFVEQRLAIAGGDPDNPQYLQAALAVIAENPLRFGELLARKVLRALAQPAGTTFFAGPSLKTMLVEAVVGRVSPWALLGDPTFWPKALIYLWHFGTIGLGVAAMGHTRSRWRETSIPILTIVSVTGTYALLTIIPRYIFPIMPFFTIFAALALARLWSWRGAAPERLRLFDGQRATGGAPGRVGESG